jgi:hypothetical protein
VAWLAGVITVGGSAGAVEVLTKLKVRDAVPAEGGVE